MSKDVPMREELKFALSQLECNCQKTIDFLTSLKETTSNCIKEDTCYPLRGNKLSNKFEETLEDLELSFTILMDELEPY